MSTQTKTSGGGGGRNKSNKNANATANSVHSDAANKKNSDHTKTEKEKPHIKPTAEQIRIAQITDIKSNVEDPKIREKVDQLMETTQRSEEDVCYALYECDNDVEKAVIYLLETLEVGAFATTSKKKKNRAAANTNDGNAAGGGSGTGTGAEDWDDVNGNSGSNQTTNNNVNNNHNMSDNRDRSRGRGGMRGGGGSGRGRPRDNNNFDGTRSGGYGDRSGDKGGDSWRGGRGRGGAAGSRGGYGGGSRGGRGGRMGPRTSNYRSDNQNYRSYRQDNQEIDSWDSSAITADIITNKTDENWGDWDNEEYTGSLSDTKVFTPSSGTQGTGGVSNPSELSAPPGLEQQILNPPPNDVVQQYSTTVVCSAGGGGSVAGTVAGSANNNIQYPELHSSSTAAQHLRQALEMPQLSQSTSLSAEQSQYFNALSSQNVANVNSYQSSTVQYGQYGDHQVSSQQAPSQVRRQRARVPPPSKIPSSAVEMPGDLNSMGFLDVQFGGLDVQFGTEETFDGVTDKFSATSLNEQPNDVSDYQSKQGGTGVSKAASQSAGLTGLGDSIGAGQNDNLSSNYVQRSASGTTGGSALDPLVKSDPYIQTSSQTSATSYQNLSYTPTSNKSAYQSSAATQVYNNSNNYSSSAQQQVSATSNYPPSSNTYSTYNQNSYQSQNQVQNSQQQQQQSQQQQQQQQPQQATQSSMSSATSGVSNTGVSGNSTNSSIPVNSGGTSSNSNPNYLSNQSGYPSVGQTQFGSQSNNYQSNNVYGNTGLSNNTGYSGSTSTAAAQYSNYNSSKLKDTPVSSTTYDGSSSNVASNVTSAVSNNSAITTSSISSPSSLGLTNTKATTNSSIKSGSGGSVSSASGTGGTGSGGSGANSNVVQNIPVVSQFIQTAGVPYYQQQFVQYEDIQLVQPRMTHMPGYYDLNYQTPTSMGAGGVRDGTTGNLGTVAYSTMTDGRFARTDNNSSPVSNVPSTISQQTASGGPMLNIPPYTTVPYFYGANMMPGGFQQAYPQIYPQQMATANPTSGGQYGKPSSYSYGSTGYDTAQDYNKTAYQSAGVGQQAKGQNVSNQSAGTSDISSSMYSKSHVALNKVNSYDKQSFHSGTPPPFNLAGVNSQTAGVNSQTQAYGQHLFIPAAMTAHHNIGIHHQMQIDGSSRIPNTSRRDTNTGQRQQSTTQSKTGTKTGYSQSYWTTQN